MWAEDSLKLQEESDDPPRDDRRRGTERRQSRLSGSELMSCISLVSELRIIRQS